MYDVLAPLRQRMAHKGVEAEAGRAAWAEYPQIAKDGAQVWSVHLPMVW